MSKDIPPFKLNESDNKDDSKPLSGSVVIAELNDKLEGLRKRAELYFDRNTASGALGVIEELQIWLENKIK